MRRMAPFFLFYALAESFSGACCGTGDTVRPMILTLLSICLLRVLGILLVLPRQHTMECIIDIYISSWIAAGIGFLILWQWEKNKVQRRSQARPPGLASPTGKLQGVALTDAAAGGVKYCRTSMRIRTNAPYDHRLSLKSHG